MSGHSDKTEKPTPKRRKDARKEGTIARTNDLPAWGMVLAATWIIPLTLRWGFEQGHLMFASFGEAFKGGQAEMLGFFGDAMLRGTFVMAPIVLLAMVIGVVGQVAQIGWAPKKMKPDIKKLNPLKGFKNLFSMRTVWEAGKNVLKLAVITLMSVAPLKEAYTTIFTSGRAMPTTAMAAVIGQVSIAFLRNVAMVGLVIAVADYWQAKRQVDKQIKMSKQEIKQEYKEQEGDPHVKGQIRSRQMAMSRNRMMAAVPDADVVLVNPTHIAVALKYDRVGGAPVVLAKGAGALADRIRAIAEDEDVPIVRDVPLARTLNRLVEVGEQIPYELYEAVARVLAFVYALRTRGRAAGTHQSPFADRHVPLMDLPKQHARQRKQPVGV